eukprot:scaffold95955_cov36-Phaeocystis_antarctica.AAC.1
MATNYDWVLFLDKLIFEGPRSPKAHPTHPLIPSSSRKRRRRVLCVPRSAVCVSRLTDAGLHSLYPLARHRVRRSVPRGTSIARRINRPGALRLACR